MKKPIIYKKDPIHEKYNNDTGELTPMYIPNDNLKKESFIMLMEDGCELFSTLDGDEDMYLISCIMYAIKYGKYNEVIEFTIDKLLINIIKRFGLLNNINEKDYKKRIITYINRLIAKSVVFRRDRGCYYLSPIHFCKCDNNLEIRKKILRDYENKWGIVSFNN